MISDPTSSAFANAADLPPALRLRVLRFLVRWGRYEEALPLAMHLAESQPDGLLYRSILAKVLSAVGRFEEAESVVSELDYRYHDYSNTLTAAGDLELARGNYPAALKHFLKILEHTPDSVQAFRHLAKLYLAAGQLEKAHAYCKKILDYYETKGKPGSDDLHPDVLRVLAAIHDSRGDASLASELESKLEAREKLEEERLRQEIAGLTYTRDQERQAEPPMVAPEPVLEPEPVRTPVPELTADALKCLKEVFGHDRFRHGQEETVARILSGQDLLVIMPTGAGKSLCYQLPAALGKKVVVISPLIALMKDQLDGLPAALSPRATLINSTLDAEELEARLSGIAEGKYNLIYAAPERLRQRPFLHALGKAGVDIFVVDEVHCVSIWGHDFRPDYLFIDVALDYLGSPLFCGMTATAGPAMRKEIEGRIGRRIVTVSTGAHRPNLMFEVHQLSNDQEKVRALGRICSSIAGSGIVYATSRDKTEQLAANLRRSGIDAGHYHAGMEPEARVAAQEAFMSGECRIMVATVAFGMGVDKSDVRFVVHFNLPKSLENYYQEAGRAGRDGLPARCILFYTSSDKGRLTAFATGQGLKMDDLKKVYQAIKKSIPSGAGPVNDYDIQKASALDDTQVRVAISMLDRAELITRRLDVPTSVSINVGKRGGAGDGFEDFAESARLRAGQNFQVDIRDLAYRTNVPLREVESALLKWRDEGCLTYRTSGRTMYIELCGSRKGARADMQAMLDTHRAEAIRKVKILADYAKSSRCRHDIISRYFGEAPITGCRSCDNCIKGGAPTKLSDEHLTILKGVECLPIRFSASALVKAFMGASGCPMKPHEWPHLGVFSGRTRDSVKQMIDDLIDWGYLVHDGTILRPLLVLTPAGRKLAVRPMRNAESPIRNADCGLRNGERDG